MYPCGFLYVTHTLRVTATMAAPAPATASAKAERLVNAVRPSTQSLLLSLKWSAKMCKLDFVVDAKTPAHTRAPLHTCPQQQRQQLTFNYGPANSAYTKLSVYRATTTFWHSAYELISNRVCRADVPSIYRQPSDTWYTHVVYEYVGSLFVWGLISKGSSNNTIHCRNSPSICRWKLNTYICQLIFKCKEHIIKELLSFCRAFKNLNDIHTYIKHLMFKKLKVKSWKLENCFVVPTPPLVACVNINRNIS